MSNTRYICLDSKVSHLNRSATATTQSKWLAAKALIRKLAGERSSEGKSFGNVKKVVFSLSVFKNYVCYDSVLLLSQKCWWCQIWSSTVSLKRKSAGWSALTCKTLRMSVSTPVCKKVRPWSLSGWIMLWRRSITPCTDEGVWDTTWVAKLSSVCRSKLGLFSLSVCVVLLT